MNGAATIVSLIALVACLLLAVRSFDGREPQTSRMVIMGVTWAVIIAAMAMLLQRSAA